MEEAVDKGLSLLGGNSRSAQDGENFLLKPNILVGGIPRTAYKWAFAIVVVSILALALVLWFKKIRWL